MIPAIVPTFVLEEAGRSAPSHRGADAGPGARGRGALCPLCL